MEGEGKDRDLVTSGRTRLGFVSTFAKVMRITTCAPASLSPVLNVKDSARVDPGRIAKRRGKKVIDEAVLRPPLCASPYRSLEAIGS